jgi:hypothetical protein
MKLGRYALIAILVAGTAAAARPAVAAIERGLPVVPRAQVSDPSLVGVWRVVKFCRDDPTGRLYDPYGPNPTGLFIYAPTGELSIQMMRTPSVGPFAAGDDRATDAERKQLFDSYLGYYGTYTVTSDSTVVHHVVGGTIPSYTGTDQARVYRIRGDTLTIGGNRVTWPCRVLLRVK